ncbi:MAG TPA: NUDIX hydrolase [Candidatus Wallbacteria bacterium]|nr:NUDIX hydrolase [Candidatus Wallbacteria bacterium]
MKKISEKVLFRGKWLAFKENIFVTKEGREVRWECVERKNSKSVVVIVPRLMPSERFVLIKQYRPALENYIIGFPAGLAGTDDIKREALKELYEETGYTGGEVKLSPPLKLNPGTINDTVYVANVDIDENAPENQNPPQHLESTEIIDVVIKKKDELKEFVTSEIEKGVSVGGGFYYTFFGLSGF